MTAELVTKGSGRVYSRSFRALLGPPAARSEVAKSHANASSNVTSQTIARPATDLHYVSPGGLATRNISRHCDVKHSRGLADVFSRYSN